MKKGLIILITAFSFSIISSYAFSSNCKKAVELYNKGTVSKSLFRRERLFKEALSLGCKDKEVLAKIHNNLADVYEKHGKVDLAIKGYQKALSLNPDLATPYFSLGDIHFVQGEFAYAIENYEKGLALKEDALAKNNLKKARQEIPLYRSKNEIVASLSVTRCIRQVPSVNLYFGFDKAIITKKSEKQLEALLKALNDRELRSFRFRITGHTCSLGSDEYNQRLSEKRAETVRNWLKTHNFPPNYLETTGFGEKKPIRDNSTEEGRKLNRRVEIRTIGVVISSKRAVHNREGILHFNEGQKLCDQSDYHGAADRFEEALRLFKKSDDKEGIRVATAYLAIAYRELGDDEKVSHYLSKYKEIENEIAGQ